MSTTLGNRPEHVMLAGTAGAATVPGRVELVEALGSDSFLSFAVAANGGGAGAGRQPPRGR